MTIREPPRRGSRERRRPEFYHERSSIFKIYVEELSATARKRLLEESSMLSMDAFGGAIEGGRADGFDLSELISSIDLFIRQHGYTLRPVDHF